MSRRTEPAISKIGDRLQPYRATERMKRLDKLRLGNKGQKGGTHGDRRKQRDRRAARKGNWEQDDV